MSDDERRCHYCRRADVQLTRDHIVPRFVLRQLPPLLVGLPNNIVKACLACNGRKGNLRSLCRCCRCTEAWEFWSPHILACLGSLPETVDPAVGRGGHRRRPGKVVWAYDTGR